MFASPHVSVVTGATGGIGAATALELAGQGSAVVIHYHRGSDKAEALRSEIVQKGGEAIAVPADLRQRSEAIHLVGAALERFGRIDLLVNNAGSMIGRRLLSEIDEGFWEEVWETNAGSLLWMTQAVSGPMARHGGGNVVNVGSVAARNGGSPGVLAYAAAKAAVICMTKSLAKELLSAGIRVNAVNPGVITTPFHERFTEPERFRALVAAIPQGRAGTAEEIARAIAFLASPAASHIVGECLEINGGLWMD